MVKERSKKEEEQGTNIGEEDLLGLHHLSPQGIGGTVIRGLDLAGLGKGRDLEDGDLSLFLNLQQGEGELVHHFVLILALLIRLDAILNRSYQLFSLVKINLKINNNKKKSEVDRLTQR